MGMTWQTKQGRDSDGDKFCTHILVHDSGRILARILAPLNDAEYLYDVSFRCRVPHEIIADDDYNHEFLDCDLAKKFVESTLAKFDPFAAPKKYVAKQDMGPK